MWIGLISYPLYLWHWPLLTLPRIVEGTGLNDGLKLAAILLSVALAAATYVYVEKPARSAINARTSIAILVSGMAVIGLSGLAIFLGSGLDSRGVATSMTTIEGDLGKDRTNAYLEANYHRCKPDGLYEIAKPLKCRQTKPTGAAEIAIVGDSHAEHLFIGIADAYSTKNIAYFLNFELPLRANKNFVPTLEYIIDSNQIDVVLISANWGRRDLGDGKDFAGVVAQLASSGKKVIIVDDVPFFRHDAEACKYSRRLRLNTRCSENQQYSRFSIKYQGYHPLLTQIAESSASVSILHIAKYLCADGACSMLNEGKLLYRDSHHLNVLGSMYFGRRVFEDNPNLFDE